ncbi:MAG: MFS transporter [Pirellulales bacterium]|nr:MFS transporter [Pirellulales bacterium]
MDLPLTRPSRTRYWVIVFAATLALITYIDRVCISQAAPAMREALGLSEIQMGWAFSAFFWAYALFEIPGGWLGDRWGARLVLTRVVVWWSFFTAFTGWVWNLPSLLVTRALFGAGEAGCFPNLTRAFMSWLPANERVRAQGLMWLSARWGGAFTPLLVALVFQFVSWRRAFELFGVIGIIWALVFYRWYRDNPKDHPSVNEGELARLPKAEDVNLGHAAVPWSRLAMSPRVWLLWAQYTCLGYGWVFYITWLPTYLKEARGLTFEKGALLAGLPLFFGGLGCVFSGSISTVVDRWTRDTRTSRRILAMTGFLGAALCLLLSIRIEDPLWAMIAMGAASFANDLVMPPAWGACMDMGGKFCGTLSGSMNMMTNLGQAVAPVLTALLLESTGHDWTVVFYVSSGSYFLGAVCWWFLDSVTPLEQG